MQKQTTRPNPRTQGTRAGATPDLDTFLQKSKGKLKKAVTSAKERGTGPKIPDARYVWDLVGGGLTVTTNKRTMCEFRWAVSEGDFDGHVHKQNYFLDGGQDDGQMGFDMLVSDLLRLGCDENDIVNRFKQTIKDVLEDAPRIVGRLVTSKSNEEFQNIYISKVVEDEGEYDEPGEDEDEEESEESEDTDTDDTDDEEADEAEEDDPDEGNESEDDEPDEELELQVGDTVVGRKGNVEYQGTVRSIDEESLLVKVGCTDKKLRTFNYEELALVEEEVEEAPKPTPKPKTKPSAKKPATTTRSRR